MKRIISIIIVICLIFSTVSIGAYAEKVTGVLAGYINTINARTGKQASYQGISKDGFVYMLPEDIADIGGYVCEFFYLEKEVAESVINSNSVLLNLYSRLNIEELFDNDKFDYLCFSRADSNTDYITQIYYHEGYAQSMGKSFEIDIVDYDGKTYLNLEKMLYLMHAQWCVDESFLYYYPLDKNIFDFISDYYNYMYEHSVQHNSLLYEGENKLGHSARIVFSHILNDVDLRFFIPFYGNNMIYQDWYEEAILQLATTDDSFIDNYGSQQITNNLKDSPYQKIEIGLNTIDSSLGAISDLPNKIADSKLNKFSMWNDLSKINTAELEVAQKKISTFGNVVSVANILVDFNEINTRSKSWNDDFVAGLELLSTINEDVYGNYGKNIVKVAENLLDEHENPTKKATETAILDTCGLVLDNLLDNTIIGHIESIVTVSNAIIKSNPDYASKIENADLMNSVHSLINVENVYLTEFVDAYHDYLHYIEVEDGTSSLRVWELMYTVTNENPQKVIETKAISDMRNALEMFLKTSLRNKTYVYHFSCFNNGGSLWTSTAEAKELENDIYKTYALLSELISTRDYDKLLYVDETFNSMYSNEYGLLRERLDVNIIKDKVASNWESELTEGYWESKIQTFELYKFNEDGTGKIYCVADMNVVDTTKLDKLDSANITSFTWKVDGDYLIIDDSCKLKFVSKSDDYNWDMGIYHHLPENEKFFYETNFVEDELGMNNAFYIARYHDNQSLNENLVANENDFNDLRLLLENIKIGGYLFEYYSSDSNAYNQVLSELLGPLTVVPIYRHIYDKKEEYIEASNGDFASSPKNERDPLNKFGSFYRYGKINADEFDWIIKNVFNVTPDREKATVVIDDICQIYYYNSFYYFSCGDGGDVGVYPVIKNKKLNTDNSYNVECELIYVADNTSIGVYEVTCKLKNIEGKKQWLLTSICEKREDVGVVTQGQSVEQLRKNIIGSWGQAGSVGSEYNFEANGICYWLSQKQEPGTYKILDDKKLIIDFPWMHNEYIWSNLSFDVFHKDHDFDEYFWYFTDDGILMLNGDKYYKNGKVVIENNTKGELLSILEGTWIADNKVYKYKFSTDGTYEEINLYSATSTTKGKIDIVDDTTAKLWQDTPEGFGYIPSYSELIYDEKTDKIYIGGKNNGYTRMN